MHETYVDVAARQQAYAFLALYKRVASAQRRGKSRRAGGLDYLLRAFYKRDYRRRYLVVCDGDDAVGVLVDILHCDIAGTLYRYAVGNGEYLIERSRRAAE